MSDLYDDFLIEQSLVCECYIRKYYKPAWNLVTHPSDLDMRFSFYVTCVSVVHCPTNLLISNGNVEFTKDGTSVTYHCADKFKLVGSASAVCEPDGTWSSSPPKCIGMYVYA